MSFETFDGAKMFDALHDDELGDVLLLSIHGFRRRGLQIPQTRHDHIEVKV